MNIAEVLEKDSQTQRQDSSRFLTDFSSFKERVWIPLLRSKISSWSLYTGIYNQYLEDFLNVHSPVTLTVQDVREFARSLKEKGLSSGTYNRILSVLKHFLKAVFEHGLIDTDLASSLASCFVRAESREGICLDADRIKMLFKKLSASASRTARAIELLILTGASKREILSARWEDYDPVHNILAVSGRQGRKRTLRLGPQSVAILEAFPRPHQSPWIFHGRDNDKHLNDVFLFWDKIRKDCGLSHIRIQDLKHNYKNWQKNNCGYSISIEDQLEGEAGKACQSNPSGAAINPEIALIGLAWARYENNKTKGHVESDRQDRNSALPEYYSDNILAAGTESLNCYARLKFPNSREKFFIDLAKTAIKNASLSQSDLGGLRSAVYLGLENPYENIPAKYQGSMDLVSGSPVNLAHAISLALGFSCVGTEINSPGCSFMSALQAAGLKIAFGGLDIALVGGVDDIPFFKRHIPIFAEEGRYAKIAILCSPAYVEKTRLPVRTNISLWDFNKACLLSTDDGKRSPADLIN